VAGEVVDGESAFGVGVAVGVVEGCCVGFDVDGGLFCGDVVEPD
jgi:hypothetical protein